MQPSPYTPGGIAYEVPGRDQQLGEITERLSYMVDLRRLVDRIRVDTAPRGLGKTSMLAKVAQLVEQRGALPVRVLAGQDGTLMQAIGIHLDRATRDWSKDLRRRTGRLIDKLTVKVGVGVAEVEATVTRKPRSLTPQGATEFQDLIQETTRGALKMGRSGLVLLIDEIQSGDADSLSALSYGWQNLQHEARDVPAAVFAAGLPNSEMVLRRAATPTERFAYRTLGPLTPDAARQALSVPAMQAGVRWTPEALHRAMATANGFPFTVQLLGDQAWRSAGYPHPGAEISLDHVAAAELATQPDLLPLLRARWEDAAPAERRFLRAMAEIGDTRVARHDIAQRLHVTSRALSVHRERLISKGILQAPEHGYLGFTINGFAEYVRAQPGDLNETAESVTDVHEPTAHDDPPGPHTA